MGEVNVNAAGLFDFAWDQWSARAGRALEAVAKEEAPVDDGELRDSISFVKTGARTGELRATASHAVIVHEGHGEITPKNPDGVLTWLNKLSGERVYAKRVGAKDANKFLTRAVQRMGIRI